MSSYRVENVEGCIVVHGSVPIRMMASILKSAGKDAVIGFELQNILGANMVVGSPANLAQLLAVSQKPSVPTQLREILGEGACNWVESGKVGSSSNFMLFTFTGFNALSWLKHGDASKAAPLAHPHDPDDLSRCRHLLEAAPRLADRLPELSAASSAWEALVGRWDELCALMDTESPNWRTPDHVESASKTYALMRECTAPKSEFPHG